MKAQISFVEFLTAMLIFITFVGYFSIQILMFIPSYINEVRSENLRSEAFQISELLINDPGEPLEWNLNFKDANRTGLSDHTQNKTNLLSGVKILALDSECQKNYDLVKEKMGLDHDFSLILIDRKTDKPKIENCYPKSITKFRQVNITIRRVIAYEEDGNINYGEMILQVW